MAPARKEAPTRKERLQKECKNLNLPSTGTVAQLGERINDYKKSHQVLTEDEVQQKSQQVSTADEVQQKSQQVLTEDEVQLMYDAILVTESMVCDDEDMKMDAKEALEKELEKELEVDYVRGDVYVGNRRGLDLAGMKAMLEEHRGKISSLEGKVGSLEGKVGSLEGENSSLKDSVGKLQNEGKELAARVHTLSLAAEDYKRVRQRFISSFKVLKLPDQVDESDHSLIKGGNFTAHGGDAAVDALLYKVNGRKDIYAFQQLYALHPTVVRGIEHRETLAMLNRHATVRANKDRVGTAEFYEKFAAFILAFQKNNLNTEYLLDQSEKAKRTRMAYIALDSCKNKYQDSNGRILDTQVRVGL